MILLGATDVEEDVGERLDSIRIAPGHKVSPADVVVHRDMTCGHPSEQPL